MKTYLHLRMAWIDVLGLTLLLTFPSLVQAAPPDLTAAGVIATLKSNPTYSLRPYSETWNLGPTGLRGWIYIGGGNGADGTITTEWTTQLIVR